MNVKEIFDIIKQNNGLISSYQLATICGKDHTALIQRMAQVLLSAERRDSLTLMQIHDKLTGLANVRAVRVEYINGNNAKNTRIEYMMKEREAILIAMTYSYELQAAIYDAYQLYKDTLAKIANGAQNAQELAISALNSDLITKLKNGEKYQVGRYVRSMYDETKNPLRAYKRIMEAYDLSLGELFDKSSRVDFYNKMGQMFTKLKIEYRQTTPEKDFSWDMMACFAAVEREVAERQRRVARHNQTRAENKLKKAA